MSNLYDLTHGMMKMSEERQFPTTPLVKLGDEHFSKVKKKKKYNVETCQACYEFFFCRGLLLHFQDTISIFAF